MDETPVRTSWLSAWEDYRCLGPEKGKERLWVLPTFHPLISFFFKNLFIYVTVPGLRWGTWNLIFVATCRIFLVASFELLVEVCGI